MIGETLLNHDLSLLRCLDVVVGLWKEAVKRESRQEGREGEGKKGE